MAHKNETACPACEYEKNTHGRPVESNGQMQCLDCGSTWRVFGTSSPLAFGASKKPEVKIPTKKLEQQIPFTLSEPEPSFVSQINLDKYKPGLGMMMSCFAIFILSVGIFLGLQLFKPSQHTLVADRLNISDIKIDEQVRRNGDKVFTVTGLVSNPSVKAKTIPPIAIILRQKNGDEITRWYYNSSLGALLPGRKSRFASSIQYDTPIVAYAEAVFKK